MFVDCVDHRPDIFQAFLHLGAKVLSSEFAAFGTIQGPKMSMSVRLSCSSDDSDTVHLQILGLDGTRMDVAVPWLHFG